MSKKSANSLIVKLKVSPRLAVVLTALHLGALVMVFIIAVPGLLRLVLATALLLSLYAAVARHALRHADEAVAYLRWDSKEGLALQFRRQEQWQLATITSCFVHPWLVLLSLRLVERRLSLSLIVPADAVEPEVFRRLRAALLAPRQSPAA